MNIRNIFHIFQVLPCQPYSGDTVDEPHEEDDEAGQDEADVDQVEVHLKASLDTAVTHHHRASPRTRTDSWPEAGWVR